MARLIAKLASLLCLLLSVALAQAEIEILDLREAIRTGDVQFLELRGNGSSSGAAVDGVLKNITGRELSIRTAIKVPLYFRNRGSGSRQNMIATQIYLSNGAYVSDGKESFIQLSPGASEKVMLIAYCADFDKENPEALDTFVLADTPEALSGVARRIADFEAKQPDLDTTVASQVALWMAQGLPAQKIADKFEFTENDYRGPREILGNE